MPPISEKKITEITGNNKGDADGKKIIKETIHAKGVEIGIYTADFENEFISLTDIAKYRNEDDPRFVIQNWMRNPLKYDRISGSLGRIT